MTERHSKTIFSAEEYRRIIALVRELETATVSKQKSIRAKIRKIGLYWSEVTSNEDYTVVNLQNLVERGILKVERSNTNNSFAKDNSVLTQSNIRLNSMKDAEMSKLAIVTKGRKCSDEHYVIDLCDEILGCKASRQYRFDFLKGDAGTSLPVDAYYPEQNIVVEYHESQHTESTPFFDNKKTVSGVSRGEQRKIYDQRRKDVLPEHGILLVIISYTDLGETKKLKRNHNQDLEVVKDILKRNGVKI